VGVLVSGWAGGEAWSAAEVRLPANIEAMARLLRQVHALQICKPARTRSPAAWIAHYSQSLSRGPGPSPRCRALGAEAAVRLERVTAVGTAGVLCHSDLHRLNVKTGPPVVLLDWEYAHVSDPLWDLAGWVSNNDGSAEFASGLHGRYLGRGPSGEESTRLEQFIWLYEYVALLWSELYLSLRPGGAPGVAARANELGRRLGQATGGRAGQVTAH
jgi:thiamine kinase-like enzyme